MKENFLTYLVLIIFLGSCSSFKKGAQRNLASEILPEGDFVGNPFHNGFDKAAEGMFEKVNGDRGWVRPIESCEGTGANGAQYAAIIYEDAERRREQFIEIRMIQDGEAFHNFRKLTFNSNRVPTIIVENSAFPGAETTTTLGSLKREGGGVAYLKYEETRSRLTVEIPKTEMTCSRLR